MNKKNYTAPESKTFECETSEVMAGSERDDINPFCLNLSSEDEGLNNHRRTDSYRTNLWGD